jgi:hypothetical protein
MENTMDKKQAKLINSTLKSAYSGEDNVALSAAIARLCAEMYDPYMKLNPETGAYEEVNSHQWEQFFFMQTIANHLWGAMYDTRLSKPRSDGKQYVKGNALKLDKAQQHLKNVSKAYDGTEIALNALETAENWVQRLEEKQAMFEELYHMVADFMEVACGMAHKPYEPWVTETAHKPAASSDKEAEIAARLAERGIEMSVGQVANTDGVATEEVA